MPRLDPQVQLTLIHGDAPFAIEGEARRFVHAVLPPEEQAYGLTVIDFETTPVTEAVSALYSGSLMAGKRVLLLRNLQALRAGAARPKEPAEDDEPAESEPAEEKAGPGAKPPQRVLTEALASIPPGVFVVLTHVSTREKKGYAVSSGLTKLVGSKGQTAQFKAPWESELSRWVVQEAREGGKRLDEAAANLLVELTGRDQGQLSSELEKVVTYAGKAERITADDVAAVAVRSAEATSFQLVDAIAEGDAAKALAMLPDLVPAHNAASAAIPLLGMIARNLRLLWQASYLGRNRAPVDRGKPPEALAELLPMQQNVTEAARSDFVARKLAGHARNFTDAQAALSLERVLYADQALKGQTGEHLDPRLVVERLVTELCLLAQRSPE